jgi:hypothetical protein
MSRVSTFLKDQSGATAIEYSKDRSMQRSSRKYRTYVPKKPYEDASLRHVSTRLRRPQLMK